MPRKVKQRQNQKQSQTVVVNIGRRRRAASKRSASLAPRPPPFMPIPFPVPALRGPEPLIQAQPSLAQLIEALRPAGLSSSTPAPPVSAPPAPASPAPIPDIVYEGKEETGPERVVAPPLPIVTPPEPLVSASPAVTLRKRPKMAKSALTEEPSHASSSSSSKSTPDFVLYSDEELQKMVIRNKDRSRPGQMTLEDVAKTMGLTVPKKARDNKEKFIQYIKQFY